MMKYLLLMGLERFLFKNFQENSLYEILSNTLTKVLKNCIILLKKFVVKQSNKSGYERFQNSK